jgi:hypothetical protein
MNTIRLDKGTVILMLPFRMGPGWLSGNSVSDTELWTRTEVDTPRLDFLLDHVRDFFVANTRDGINIDSSCIIARLKKETFPFKLFNNKSFWLSNKAFDTHPKAKIPSRIPVTIDPSSFRVIYHPFTGIALLLFNVDLATEGKENENSTLASFVEMNYLLRLFNRHDEAYLISCNERPEERSRALQLTANKDPGLFENKQQDNITFTGWRPGQLINFLLHDLNKKFGIELFDHQRFYPVTYAQPSQEIKDEKIVHHALFYLRKVYNSDFAPAAEVLQRESELFRPFRQIWYANSLEGATVFNNCSPEDPEFIKTFYSNSFTKSLWLTILGVMQRTIFLQLMKEVSRIDPNDHQMVKEYLLRYTRISLKAIFSKVSVYHQHNDYYMMMISNFQINGLQTELKDELTELNNILRQSHEDEVEKNNLLEKQSDRRLSVILFILSIFGFIEVIYKLMENKEMSPAQHIVAIVFPLLTGIVSGILINRRKK